MWAEATTLAAISMALLTVAAAVAVAVAVASMLARKNSLPGAQLEMRHSQRLQVSVQLDIHTQT